MLAETVQRNLADVETRIRGALQRSRRTDTGSVKVVAATKYVDVAGVDALAQAGVVDVGENRLQDLQTKRAGLARHDLTWHYIGRLQSRKVAHVVPEVSWIHTLCTMSAAAELERAVQRGQRLPRLLVQVNIARDPAKSGIPDTELEAFVASLPPSLRIAGLMTMPPHADGPSDSRRWFDLLRRRGERLAARLPERLEPELERFELSMGTTQDFEVAVEEGATVVRLGRVLYAAHDSA